MQDMKSKANKLKLYRDNMECLSKRLREEMWPIRVELPNNEIPQELKAMHKHNLFVAPDGTVWKLLSNFPLTFGIIIEGHNDADLYVTA